jgi:hypothetical protein
MEARNDSELYGFGFWIPADCTAMVDDFAVIEHRSIQDVAADMFRRGLRNFLEDRERIVAELRRKYIAKSALEVERATSRRASCRP